MLDHYNTRTADLLDEGSQKLSIWHPDDCHQDDDNKEKQGTSTTVKEERHDSESFNKQETTLRRDASDVEEAGLYEKSIATRGSLRYSNSLYDSDTEDFSQSETVVFTEEILEQVKRAEARRATRVRKVLHFLGKSIF